MHTQTLHSNKRRLFKTRKLTAFAIGLGSGVLLCARFLLGANHWTAFAFMFVICACAVFAYTRNMIGHIIGFVAMLLGICITVFAYPTPHPDGVYNTHGQVYEIEKNSITLDHITINGMSLHGKAILHAKLQDQFNVGDVIEFNGNVTFVANSHDEIRFSILARKTVAEIHSGTNATLVWHKHSLREFVVSARKTIEHKIDTLFKNNADIARGILLGQSGMIDFGTISNARTAGIAHIFALSGLHVSILASALMYILKSLKGWIKLSILGAFLFMYCAITAFPPSLVRAAIISFLILQGSVIKRQVDYLTLLSCAFTLIIIFNPYALFSAGFTMSFSAVLGIILLHKPLEELMCPYISEEFSAAFSTTIGASLGILPCLMGYFNTIPLYGTITNLFVVPYASVIVLAAFCTTALSFLCASIAIPLAFLTDILLDILVVISDAIAQLPFAIITVPQISVWTGLLYFTAMISVSKYVMMPRETLEITFISKSTLKKLKYCGAILILTIISGLVDQLLKGI